MSESPALPLYEEIAADLLRAIEAGTHPVGSMLPPEIEIADRYKVSRHTIRMAMRRLTEIGAVSRRAGSGTRVEARNAAPGSFQWTLASLADLTRLAAITTREIQSIERLVLDRQQARDFGAQPGTRWVRLSYLRREASASDKPMGWVDVYLDERYADVLRAVRDGAALISDLVEERYGVIVSEVRQDVRVSAVNSSVAGALEASPGSPALQIIRRYYDQRSNLFEISVSTHPEGRYTISSTLKRKR